MLKKSLIGSSILFRFVSGGLILFVIFRLFRKKKEESTETTPGYKSSSSLPTKSNLTYDEIYQLIRKEEGINYTAKRDGSDTKGNPLYTIGIGHQIQPNEKDLLTARITEKDAVNLFQKDISKIVEDLKNKVKVPLNKNQELALLSLRYRIGPNYFAESTLLKELNQGNYQKASEEFKNWRISDGVVVNGLVLRAERERLRFNSPETKTGIYTPVLSGSLGKPTGSPFSSDYKGTPTQKTPLFIPVPYFPFFIPNFK